MHGGMRTAACARHCHGGDGDARARARCDSPHECGVGHVLSRNYAHAGTLVHDLPAVR